MVHIYTFCDKTLIGRLENLSAKFLCENLYKMNLKIDEVCIFKNKYDYQSINFKNKDIYFLLMQKSNNVLNSYLATLLNSTCQENQTLKNAVNSYYSLNNIPQENDASLEYIIPKDATAITNPNGKTQGYLIKVSETEIFVLPNNFLEFKKIYNDCILEYLEKNKTIEYQNETYKTFGIAEDYIKTILQDEIKNKDGVSISIFSNGLDNNIVLKSKNNNLNFEQFRRKVFEKLEKYIYSVKDENLINVLLNEINQQNITISLAGDLSASLILNNFLEINNKMLDSYILPTINLVNNFTNKNHTQITNEMVFDVAVKLLEKTKPDLSVVIFTQKEGSITKTYIAIGNKVKVDIYKNQFSGNQEEVEKNIVNSALFYLIKRLKCRDLKTL